MKLTRVLSAVLFMSICCSPYTYGASSFSQVRNSLWTFGVDNHSTTEVEMITGGLTQIPVGINESSVDDDAELDAGEVPEELGMAIAKFES